MIALGNDHAGYQLKRAIVAHLNALGLDYKDYGAYTPDCADYPVYAQAVANAVAEGSSARGILICGTGIGMSIAANKVRGVRCALCSSPELARMARRHNDANVLALGARVTGEQDALAIVDAWLNTQFDGESRHARRLAEIEKLESNDS